MSLVCHLKRKANPSKPAPDPHEMFWKPNINQGPIVEGTLKNNYISLVFIELGWQHYPVGDFISHAVPFW